MLEDMSKINMHEKIIKIINVFVITSYQSAILIIKLISFSLGIEEDYLKYN